MVPAGSVSGGALCTLHPLCGQVSPGDLLGAWGWAQ